MGELSEISTLLKMNVERIHAATDETNGKIAELKPEVYAEPYIQKKRGELRAELGSTIDPITTNLKKKLEEVLPKYEPSNRLRRATLLPEGSDKGAESLARNQLLVELELLSEDQFDAEVSDMVKSKNLAGLHLATLAIKQRKYPDGYKKTWLEGRINEALQTETKVREEIAELALDLESAMRAVQGGEDSRRKMKAAVARYRESHSQKGKGE
jgi:hypothetical protein